VYVIDDRVAADVEPRGDRRVAEAARQETQYLLLPPLDEISAVFFPRDMGFAQLAENPGQKGLVAASFGLFESGVRSADRRFEVAEAAGGKPENPFLVARTY
jgi:hypothetical protein